VVLVVLVVLVLLVVLLLLDESSELEVTSAMNIAEIRTRNTRNTAVRMSIVIMLFVIYLTDRGMIDQKLGVFVVLFRMVLCAA